MATAAQAQGVTTGSLIGKVVDAQQKAVAGASVIAIHLPSGTSYETTTRADGKFSIPGVRVGGPYSVTVAYSGTGAAAFQPETQENIEVALGNATDLEFSVKQHRGYGNHHRHRQVRHGVQLGSHRLGHRSEPRNDRRAADRSATVSTPSSGSRLRPAACRWPARTAA